MDELEIGSDWREQFTPEQAQKFSEGYEEIEKISAKAIREYDSLGMDLTQDTLEGLIKAARKGNIKDGKKLVWNIFRNSKNGMYRSKYRRRHGEALYRATMDALYGAYVARHC